MTLKRSTQHLQSRHLQLSQSCLPRSLRLRWGPAMQQLSIVMHTSLLLNGGQGLAMSRSRACDPAASRADPVDCSVVLAVELGTCYNA